EKENAPVYGKGSHVSAIRNHAQREDGDGGEDNRREKMHDLIRTRGHDIFLDQHFDAVSDGLEQTEWADAIRAIAVLHPRENFPLQHRYKRKEREKHRKHRNNVDEAGDDLDQPTWRTGNQEKQPSLQMNKDLVKRRTHLSARKAIAADLIKSESQVRSHESGGAVAEGGDLGHAVHCHARGHRGQRPRLQLFPSSMQNLIQRFNGDTTAARVS